MILGLDACAFNTACPMASLASESLEFVCVEDIQ